MCRTPQLRGEHLVLWLVLSIGVRVDSLASLKGGSCGWFGLLLSLSEGVMVD